LGGRMRFFNVIVLVVVVLFHARIAALQWVYATSMLVLLSGASLAALADLRQRACSSVPVLLAAILATVALVFFAAMAVLTVAISRAGLEIALAFGGAILMTSLLSRWIRSTELRFNGFEFADEESRQRWEKCCAHEFQVLIPHRPGLHSRLEKLELMRERHRLGSEVPVILIEAQLGDPSDFFHKPLMKVSRVDGCELIEVSHCVSVAHVLAAISLAMCRVGKPAEFHFGWSDESPLAANLNFLLFGEGNIPWMVRELVSKAEPDPERRPRIVVG
ncbi:MAG TPA: hypothetical protein VL475_10345, partial [Planctomycetaceae bacterium]|nr:hypothetical protein [Planctomycetaceae bacterium]